MDFPCLIKKGEDYKLFFNFEKNNKKQYCNNFKSDNRSGKHTQNKTTIKL